MKASLAKHTKRLVIAAAELDSRLAEIKFKGGTIMRTSKQANGQFIVTVSWPGPVFGSYHSEVQC